MENMFVWTEMFGKNILTFLTSQREKVWDKDKIVFFCLNSNTTVINSKWEEGW